MSKNTITRAAILDADKLATLYAGELRGQGWTPSESLCVTTEKILRVEFQNGALNKAVLRFGRLAAWVKLFPADQTFEIDFSERCAGGDFYHGGQVTLRAGGACAVFQNFSDLNKIKGVETVPPVRFDDANGTRTDFVFVNPPETGNLAARLKSNRAAKAFAKLREKEIYTLRNLKLAAAEHVARLALLATGPAAALATARVLLKARRALVAALASVETAPAWFDDSQRAEHAARLAELIAARAAVAGYKPRMIKNKNWRGELTGGETPQYGPKFEALKTPATAAATKLRDAVNNAHAAEMEKNNLPRFFYYAGSGKIKVSGFDGNKREFSRARIAVRSWAERKAVAASEYVTAFDARRKAQGKAIKDGGAVIARATKANGEEIAAMVLSSDIMAKQVERAAATGATIEILESCNQDYPVGIIKPAPLDLAEPQPEPVQPTPAPAPVASVPTPPAVLTPEKSEPSTAAPVEKYAFPDFLKSYRRAKENIYQKCFGNASRYVMPGDARAARAEEMTIKLTESYRAFFNRRNKAGAAPVQPATPPAVLTVEKSPALDPNIGREFIAPSGLQKIIARELHKTGDLYISETVGKPGEIRKWGADDLESTIARYLYETTPEYAAEQKERAEIAQLQADNAARAKAKRDAAELDVAEFAHATGLSGRGTGKAKLTLLKLVQNKGNILTRKDLIEVRVNAGAVIETEPSGRVLTWGDGYFFGEETLTKTGMDYAAYLIELRDAQAAAAPVQPTPAPCPAPAPVASVPTPPAVLTPEKSEPSTPAAAPVTDESADYWLKITRDNGEISFFADKNWFSKEQAESHLLWFIKTFPGVKIQWTTAATPAPIASNPAEHYHGRAAYHCGVCGDGFGESTKHLLTVAAGKNYCGKSGCFHSIPKPAEPVQPQPAAAPVQSPAPALAPALETVRTLACGVTVPGMVDHLPVRQFALPAGPFDVAGQKFDTLPAAERYASTASRVFGSAFCVRLDGAVLAQYRHGKQDFRHPAAVRMAVLATRDRLTVYYAPGAPQTVAITARAN